MEYFDIYREDGSLTGETIRRGDPVPAGGRILLVHTVIIDQDNRFLIQKRSMTKRHFPGMWDFAGGHVQAGESSLQGAAREAEEEVGLHFEPSQLVHAARTMSDRDFFDVYYVKAQFTLSDCHPQEEEVDELALLPYDETVRILHKDPWYSAVLQDIARRVGAIEQVDAAPEIQEK